MHKLFTILLIVLSISVFADNTESVLTSNIEINNILPKQEIKLKLFSDTSKFVIDEKGDTVYLKKRKFTAILLTILTGPVGGHRLYLGTKPIVPVVYAVTLGGGFLVIPIMDLITIIFTKDLSKFEDNDKILMWLEGDDDEFYE